jgi:hypothetical protein
VDASDADVTVMHQQKKAQHPLQDDERKRTIEVYTDDDEALFLLTDRLKREAVIRE